MTAYAIAHLRPAAPHPEIARYIEEIQATMDPFGGRFRVHNAEVEVREGEWPGALVVLEFPDIERARAWYDSPAYQEILPLRARHIEGDLVLVPGVADDYDATRTAAGMRARGGWQ
ncbi:DUF1330 domain-containing protein [Streptomyces natalensis]|uniref:DUF1330 domain-containing protein n=1 Tax=Streptomyces natalensis ATCC 27448 TaxID=1240678 RepID=A0A0D7CME1_9ACTN|nr:DUF1330 domain-containing protein [Streptomyces natalensis]KIZ17348.1 hypothetical protein SNA_15150 [Streptomyces natalensis ATCC 27448]